MAEIGVPVLGAMRRQDALATPSRHLGLVPVAERAGEALATVAALGEAVAAACDLDAVLALARSAPALGGPVWDPGAEVTVAGRRPVVAVAGGAAFSFSYTETTELLRAAGAEVVTVDPLQDEALPSGTQGLVIGGGFPEVFAADLAANHSLRQAVSGLAAAGAPIAAECAGLLYLARSLDGAPMCGLLDAEARMTGRLTLGYREAVAACDSVLLQAGSTVRGHEFHRTAVSPSSSAAPAWRWAAPDGTRRAEGFAHGAVHASYLHTHWAGNPSMASSFVHAAALAGITR